MQPIELTWPGGEHAFCLRLGELRAIQDRCDAGPGWVLARLSSGQWRVEDVIEPIRHGLEGGGMEKQAAGKLATAMAEENLGRCVLTARYLMEIALHGVQDDPVGGKRPGEPGAGE